MELQIKPDQNKKFRNFGFSRKLYIFIICFLISSFIWILIKLSREYTEVLKYPVTYTNIPADKVVVNDLDSVFTIKLKSKGFRILSNKMFFKPHNINIDVASLIRKKKNSRWDYYISTSDLCQVIGTQIHYPNNVISVIPDTLYFHFEKLYSKKVPVHARLSLDFAQQYKLSDSLRPEPDSVKICGSKQDVDSVKYIETVSKSLTNLKQTQVLNLDFSSKFNKGKLKIAPSSVKIVVPVEKYTEATIELPITIINNFNNYIVRTFPEKVNITYLVSLNKYKDVKPEMFTVVADISKVLQTKSKKMKVEIRKSPSFVEISKTEPEKVEFLFIK